MGLSWQVTSLFSFFPRNCYLCQGEKAGWNNSFSYGKTSLAPLKATLAQHFYKPGEIFSKIIKSRPPVSGARRFKKLPVSQQKGLVERGLKPLIYKTELSNVHSSSSHSTYS